MPFLLWHLMGVIPGAWIAGRGLIVGRIKRAVHSGLEVGFEQGLALERELQQQLFQSEDASEGLQAYLAKRPPQFKGK